MRSALSQRLRAWAERDGRGYPDWAARYVPILRRWRGAPGLATPVLEVGANENGYARFARVPVVAVDLAPEHLRAARASQQVRPVCADIAALPFRDDTFARIVCVDTFEHLPAEIRPRAAAELLRVLRRDGRGVVAFPSGAAAAEAETRVCAAYRAHTGGGAIRWLEEHRACGLPDAESLLRDFTAANSDQFTVTRGRNLNLRVWAWMWHVLMCGWPGRGNALAQVLLRLLTPLLTRAHFGVCYRAMFWIEPRR